MGAEGDKMSRNRSGAEFHAETPVIERLESRRLMSYFPIISAAALTADVVAYQAPHVDANLTNPRGLAVVSNNEIEVANHGTGKLTAYSATGVPATTVGTV